MLSMKNKYGIIVQARLGSTRFPEKIIRDIGGGVTFLDVLLKKLKNADLKIPIVLATTTNPNDEPLLKFAQKYKAHYYRGSEQNVLQRFVDTADFFDIEFIVRICSDNPFFDLEMLRHLIASHKNEDYISFSVNEKPSILTHYGFFVEIVSLRALKKVITEGSKHCIEHVTNCVYNQPDKFLVKFIPITIKNESIRCTLDTSNDFENLKQIYHQFDSGIQIENKSYQEIVDFISKEPKLLQSMNNQIIENSK